MEVVEHHVFRVTRNADLEVEEDRDEDLLQALERELARRRFGPPVRLEVTDEMSEHMLELLLRELDVDPHDVVQVPGLLDLSALMAADVARPPGAQGPAVRARPPTRRSAEGESPKSVFATLREGDVLVHHPYDSFSTSVQRFIEQAAADPKVLAIKQTLYRTSGDSPIVEALIDAAEAGKQVVVARRDQGPLRRARQHQVGARAGAGRRATSSTASSGSKTHCQGRAGGAPGGRRRSAATATSAPATTTRRPPGCTRTSGCSPPTETIGADLTDLFNVLTGYSPPDRSTAACSSRPTACGAGMVERIDAERERPRAGEPAGIRIKVNGARRRAGHRRALPRVAGRRAASTCVVRGICALRPGVPGLSENIRVRSILGRFLEHSRIFHFVGADEHWIGSADMMHRNLDRRVEALVPVTDPRLVAQLDDILDSATAPSTRCWVLEPDGSWTPWPVAAGEGTDGMQVCDHQTQLLMRREAKG